MKPSIEILYHCSCDSCRKWWTVADLKPIAVVTCPHCGQKNAIEGYINGAQQEVSGVRWTVKRQRSGLPTAESMNAVMGKILKGLE